MAPAAARLPCTSAGFGAGSGGAGGARWAGVGGVGAAGVGATRWAGVGAAGVGATRLAGVGAELEVGNLKCARFLRTLSRLLTFIGCFCTMVARAAVS